MVWFFELLVWVLVGVFEVFGSLFEICNDL